MTTVYIVTSGSYSDYGIRRVFMLKPKAYLYASTVPDSQVEEWETDDCKEVGIFRSVTAELRISHGGLRYIDVTVRKHSEMDLDRETVERSIYFNCLSDVSYNPREYLEITRIVPSHIPDETVQERYKKVIEDLYAQIRSLIDVEGWSGEMVEEWLADKGRLDN